MKSRIVVLFIILTVFKIYSYEEVLIDFNNLENTEIDFSKAAGDVWTKEQKDKMKMGLDIENWMIKINDSSWTNEARDKTYVLRVDNSLNYPDQNVLGVRVYFPQRYADSHAEIVPPFLIPMFYEDPKNPDGQGDMFLNKGVVRNVGVIRSLSVRFLGNNFRYSLYVRIQDNLGTYKDIFIGYLDYVGWKTKIWRNPNIDDELKARQLRYKTRPYYPDEMPSVRLIAFVILRNQTEITGNFITMIKDVRLEFDEAFLEVGKAEYKQEDIFGIYKEDLMERARIETRNVDRRIYLEWVESQRTHKEPEEEKTEETTNP